MVFEIIDFNGKKVELEPRVELYRIYDFMDNELPGLAIALYEIGASNFEEKYAMLTVSFGQFIGPKNCAYIDTHNCYFADQLLRYNIAEPTPLTKKSGFCTCPLWQFNEDFLQEIGGANYQKYIDAYEKYFDIVFGLHDNSTKQMILHWAQI